MVGEVEELEGLIMDAMSKGILIGTMSQEAAALHVTYSKSRDVRQESRAQIAQSLKEMYEWM